MTSYGQSIRFFCSKCYTVLNAAAPDSLSEECPGCGCQLSETLQVHPKRREAHKRRAFFQTAYDINACLGLGIAKIDSFLALQPADRLCVIGSHANLLVTRLCVRAFMSVRQGGLDAGSVVFIDAGNSSDMYRWASFARQLGLEIQRVLRGVAVSRAFTIHQLAGLVTHELPKIMQQLNPKLVIISDLLKMFTEDPQVNHSEARYLINEIMEAMRKTNDALLIMSLHGSSPYDCQILPSFDKRIEMDRLNIKLHSGSKSKQISLQEKELHIVR